MSRRFEGQVAIVTAAGSGIGQARALRFAAEGACVLVADLSGTRARATAQAIAEAGGEAAWIKMDAAEPPAIEDTTVALALQRWGRLDVLVNNAGYGEPALLCETTVESWNRTLAVTLTSVFLGLKYALPVMRRQGKGAVVNTASVSGIAGDVGMPAYNAAKAGDRADELRATMAAVHPLQRMGSAQEIAAAIAFLASDEASFITGAALVADGGLTAATGLPPHVAR